MINGHLSEAHQGFAILDEVEKDTFVRFIIWMYNKDYPEAQHAIIVPEGDLPKESAQAGQDPDDDWSFWGSKKDKKKGKKKAELEKQSLKETFLELQIKLEKANDSDGAPAFRSNQSATEDYTQVFFSHAKMYVFAEKYDIQPLRQLALYKLHRCLAIHTLFEERVSEITDLLKYVYANTAETKSETEDIRTVLAHYVGTEMNTLSKHGDIKGLFVENEEMMSDFLDMFASRIG